MAPSVTPSHLRFAGHSRGPTATCQFEACILPSPHDAVTGHFSTVWENSTGAILSSRGPVHHCPHFAEKRPVADITIVRQNPLLAVAATPMLARQQVGIGPKLPVTCLLVSSFLAPFHFVDEPISSVI